MTACGRGGNLDAALSLLDLMRERGVSPNCYTFNSAIHACARKVGTVYSTVASCFFFSLSLFFFMFVSAGVVVVLIACCSCW